MPADWRRQTLARVRELIQEADPDCVEEVKWVKPSNPDAAREIKRLDREKEAAEQQQQQEAAGSFFSRLFGKKK